MGDMAYNHNSGMLMVVSNAGSTGYPQEIATVDPDTGVVVLSEPLNNGGMEPVPGATGQFQLTWDASSAIALGYNSATGGNDPNLATLNCQSGNTSDPLPIGFSGMSGTTICNMAEWISQPCSLTGI